MNLVTFADVVHQSISFDLDDPAQALVLKLIDNPWLQRLRDINQTANTRLVYMFSEHSRFGHCLGVAFLANQLMDKLAHLYPEEIKSYRMAVNAAAILHDIGHLAPGSHTAFKVWFPDAEDCHEKLGARIILEDQKLNSLLRNFDQTLPEKIIAILDESETVPPWTWEIISGGGWNVDRGNWCIVDSVFAGVSYGHYNINALTESMVLTPDKHLALRENRLDAMMHFSLSRHAMYKQIYQHRVILSADTLYGAVVARARDLGGSISFADQTMVTALAAKDPATLSLQTIFGMRESWWRYHLFRWLNDPDKTIADLSRRLLERDLFKTVALEPGLEAELKSQSEQAVQKAGYDPKYYLHKISTVDVQEGDSKKSMAVIMDDGRVRQLADAEPLFQAMVKTSRGSLRSWLTMPAEAKKLLGRKR